MPGQQRRVRAVVIACIPLSLQTSPITVIINQVVANPKKVLREIVIPAVVGAQYDRPPWRDAFHELDGEEIGPRLWEPGSSGSCAGAGDWDWLQVSLFLLAIENVGDCSRTTGSVSAGLMRTR